jgi:urease accessory protein
MLAGSGALVARRTSRGTTELSVARASSPLRLLRPSFPGTPAATVCLVTFGGGLVDGDHVDLDVIVEEGATLVLFTSSTTKAFRGSSSQSFRAAVRGTLVLVPDPVACFAGARYLQRVDIDITGDGACVVLDGLTSGRPAYGDRWAFASVDLATTVTRDGRVILRDRTLLDAADAPVAPRMGRFEALLTLLAYGTRAGQIAADLLEEGPVGPDLVVAPSPLPRAAGVPAALARVAAISPGSAIAEARRRLRNLPEIEAVDPFSSRY